jgi:Fic family protein
MARDTTRDQLWTFALKVTHRSGNSIDAEQLATMADSSERSARDVLKTMAEKGFLKYDKKGREVRYIANESLSP